MRIGLLADTHMPGSRSELWPQLIEAFAGVDMILHAGDLHTASVIDLLSSIAPIYVARGNGDVGVQHPQLRDSWLLDLAGVQVGMVHEFPFPGRAADAKINKRLARHFANTKPNVVIYGHTHHASLHNRDNILFVNPGSPMLPRNQSTRLGTIAILEIEAARAQVQLLQLTEGGVAPIDAKNSSPV